jgi:hypothetical protein
MGEYEAIDQGGRFANHKILQGQAIRPFSTVKKSIQQHPRSMPHWILVHFKLKFCWKKLLALIVTSIV